jgi:hypothetical protein
MKSSLYKTTRHKTVWIVQRYYEYDYADTKIFSTEQKANNYIKKAKSIGEDVDILPTEIEIDKECWWSEDKKL